MGNGLGMTGGMHGKQELINPSQTRAKSRSTQSCRRLYIRLSRFIYLQPFANSCEPFRTLLSGHQAVAIENAALRLQLAAFRRQRKPPVLTVVMWRRPLIYVQADTSPADNANGFADSGPASEVGPLRPPRFAD